jgi:uncharacterized protein involved in exopolysaccharide biosynthesis
MATESTPSLAEYLAALRRRRPLMVSVALPIILVAVILALALPDLYRSSATFGLVTGRFAESLGDPVEYVDQYVMSLAERVLDNTNLAGMLSEADPYPELGDDELAALEELRDNVTVEMTTQTILEPGGGRERTVNTGFIVSYDHRSPDKAQQVAAGLAEAFVKLSRAERLISASNKVRFFAGEADRTSGEIAEFERQLAEFKERNFERLPESAQANLTTRARLEDELDAVEREIGTVRQNRVFVAEQLRQAQAGPMAGDLRELEDQYARKAAVYAENHPDLVALRRQIESLRTAGPATGGNTLRAQLETQRAALAEARQRYSADHPDIRRMQRNIEALEARIAGGESPTTSVSADSMLAVQLQTQVNALETQLAGLQARGLDLRRRLEQFESRLGSTPEVEREYQGISRSLGTGRQQFDQMVARRMDAEVEVAAITGGASDRFELATAPATPWEPSSPNRLAIVIMGLILAMIVALSAAVATEAFDSRVRGAADVWRTMGQTPLATVPQIHNSVYFRLRTRRAVRVAASLLIATPVLYFLIHFLVN